MNGCFNVVLLVCSVLTGKDAEKCPLSHLGITHLNLLSVLYSTTVLQSLMKRMCYGAPKSVVSY